MNAALSPHKSWIDKLFAEPEREQEVSSEPPSYIEFLRETYPRGWTVKPRHIKEISDRVDMVMRRDIDRLAVHMPPRHGKSESLTYRLPVYWQEQNPGSNVLVTGYNQEFAHKFGRKTRDLAMRRGTTNSRCKASAGEWETKDGGLCMFRGVGTPPTGTGFSLILIDDPIRSRQDAESSVMRENAWDWYTNDLYTRLEPGGVMVLVMTLWHEDDVGFRIVQSDPQRWHTLKLPAIAGENDQIGREVGEALWPERYGIAELEEIRQVLTRDDGERSWLALYQCDPRAREGNFFHPDKIQVLETAPQCTRTVMRWDLAASTDGDFTAGVHMGILEDGSWCVLDVVRGRWLPSERNAVILKTVSLKGPAVLHCFSQDPGQAGVDQRRDLSIKLAGSWFKWVRETGDKTTRADPFSSQVNAGNVSMVKADWNRAFTEELRSFIAYADNVRDDQVDAASGAHALLVRPAKREGAGFKRQGGYV